MILRTAKLRVDADTHARPRQLEYGSDRAVSGRQPGGGIPGAESRRTIRMDSENIGGATVRGPEPPRKRMGACAARQDERLERAADHAFDPAIPPKRKDRPPARTAATLSNQ